MLIDLHCHTKQIKKGDGKARNVTKELFRQKIEEADIKIVGITNHNAFCFDQYKELKDSVKEICQVWPGVEIDISGDPKYHLERVHIKRASKIIANMMTDRKMESSLS